MPMVPVTVREVPMSNAFFEMFLDGNHVADITSIGAIKTSITANPNKSGTDLYARYGLGATTSEPVEIKQANVLRVELPDWFEQVYSPLSAGAMNIASMKKNVLISVNDRQQRKRISHELFGCLPTAISYDPLDSNAEANTFLNFTIQYEYCVTAYHDI